MSTQPSLGGYARLSLTWGLWCPVGVGWVGPGLVVGPAGLLSSRAGKYLDVLGDRISVALRTRHMWVIKFLGTVLVAWWCKGSRVTWQLAVQCKMCWCKASLTKFTIRGLWMGLTSVVTLARLG